MQLKYIHKHLEYVFGVLSINSTLNYKEYTHYILFHIDLDRISDHVAEDGVARKHS